jgi:hypothetical protein
LLTDIKDKTMNVKILTPPRFSGRFKHLNEASLKSLALLALGRGPFERSVGGSASTGFTSLETGMTTNSSSFGSQTSCGTMMPAALEGLQASGVGSAGPAAIWSAANPSSAATIVTTGGVFILGLLKGLGRLLDAKIILRAPSDD